MLDKGGLLMSEYYKICPHCGASLDPDERCYCQSKRENELKRVTETIKVPKDKGGQLEINIYSLRRDS